MPAPSASSRSIARTTAADERARCDLLVSAGQRPEAWWALLVGAPPASPTA